MKLNSIFVNNFRCLQNFTLDFRNSDSLLLLGRNGMGKSTVLEVFRRIRQIANGETRVEHLFSTRDFSFGNKDAPIRIELTFEGSGGDCKYKIAVSRNPTTDSLYVSSEELSSSDHVCFGRSEGNANCPVSGDGDRGCPVSSARFLLPLLDGCGSCDALIYAVRDFIRGWVLLAPWMSVGAVGSHRTSDLLALDASNFLTWFHSLYAGNVSYYDTLVDALKGPFPELVVLNWTDPSKGEDLDLLLTMRLPDKGDQDFRFSWLSDGEKCFVVSAALAMLNEMRPGTLCFWDEPDNYLAISEVQGFVTRLRKTFGHGCGQLILTSHNIETIRTVGMEDTVLLNRPSHFDPVRLQPVADILKTEDARRDYIQDIITGDIYGI